MVTINVLKKFILTLKDGSKKVFETGLHTVESATASHFFVVAHSEVVKLEQETKAVEAEVEEIPAAVESDLKAALTKAGTELKALESKKKAAK